MDKDVTNEGQLYEDAIGKIPAHTLELFASLSAKSATGSYSMQVPAPFSDLLLTVEPHVCPLLPSTNICLRYLSTHNLSNQVVLDFGSGSGALAIAAVCSGAAHVDAVDNTHEAVACTSRNAVACDMVDKIHAFASDGFSQVSGRYNLIMANIPIVFVREIVNEHNFGLYDEKWILHNHVLANYRRYLMPGGSLQLCHVPLQPEWSFEKFEKYLAQSGATFGVALEMHQHGLPWRVYSLT